MARFTAVLAANATQQDKAQAVLGERMGIRDALTGRDLMPRSQLLELRQTLVEHERELAVLAATRQQIESERQAAAVRRRQLEAEARERLAAELAQKERALGTVTQELRKAKAREARRTLRAPVDGVVVDLAAHTVGGVAKEAEPLLRLVPEDAPLEVEALLAPRDIGFIRPGQPVTVKVDAFPYVRYGTLEGRVIDVPADASGGGDPGQPVYRVRVALERRELTVEGAAVALTAGMTVTADIRTGERGVLDYLLDPLLRYRHESLRER
ncbi:MAG TPA: HlyD family type I secretion periplasmic adaptor subunit [Azospirillaceae bacterium]|nr:HlyD family type I secretion periplasmic adaptor subunit [Azospirillaceae bacterium]